ncbi:MAG: helix-turn-helix domain-containing protein [SAR202 cluster bacterium]|nr:helix-turn-helix domain-containing protein [SAR202 cluster bacterium]
MVEHTSTSSEELKVRCSVCKIRSYSFCRCLPDEKLKVFSEISTEKQFIDKKTIFLQQENAKNLYNITKGNVKIYRLLSDGRIQIIGFLYPGDFFGSYKKQRYNYSAEAVGQVRTCVFEQESLDNYLEKNIVLAKELLHMTSHELTLAQDRMAVLGKMKASERVAKFILNISDQRARIGWQNNPISLPMTRQDIADYLGLTLETVSREFTKLKTSNIIKFLTSKQIYIDDRDKLLSTSN